MERLFDCRALAAKLSISTYRAQVLGPTLPHVRLGNLIRFRPEVIDGLVASGEMAERLRKIGVTESERIYVYKYGITIKQRDAMLAAQGGACAICRKVLGPFGSRGHDACVDHCHRSSCVRGILCNHCNKALGGFFENPDLLRAAADYVAGRGVANVVADKTTNRRAAQKKTAGKKAVKSSKSAKKSGAPGKI
jgi:hypothetical protein